MKFHLSLQILCNQWAWTWTLFLEDQLRFFQVFHFLMVAFYAKTFQCLKWQLTHKIWFWFSCFPLARHHAGVSTQNSAVSYNNQQSHGRTHQFPEKYRGFNSLMSLSEHSDGLNPEIPLNYNWAVVMVNHSIPLGSILFWWYHNGFRWRKSTWSTENASPPASERSGANRFFPNVQVPCSGQAGARFVEKMGWCQLPCGISINILSIWIMIHHYRYTNNMQMCTACTILTYDIISKDIVRSNL